MTDPEKIHRLFLGTFPSHQETAALKTIYEARQSLPNIKINWVPPGNWHVTWLFLGNVKESRLQPLQDELIEYLQPVHPFFIEFNEIAFWPDKRQPRMLVWEGKPNFEAEHLYQLLSKKFQDDLSVKAAHRSFKPHLTLGRIKAPKTKQQKGTQQINFPFQQTSIKQELHISNLALVESRLTPTGANYFSLKTFDLTQGSNKVIPIRINQ